MINNQSKKQIKSTNQYWPYFFMLLGGIFFAMGNMFAAQNKQLNFAMINYLRGLAMCLINYIIAKKQGFELGFKKQFILLSRRNFCHGLHGITFSFGLHYLSPQLCHTITTIGPVMVIIFDYFRNGNAFTPKQVVGTVISVVGILLAVNSIYILMKFGIAFQKKESKYNYIQSSIEMQLFVSFIVFLGISSWSYAMVVTKQLKQYNHYQIGFQFGVILIGVSTIIQLCMPYTSDISLLEFIQLFFTIGTSLYLATLFIILAMKIGQQSGKVTLVVFANVIFGYIISIFRYEEKINLIQILGSLLLFIGLFMVLLT